jgi:serine/threonine protein kinase
VSADALLNKVRAAGKPAMPALPCSDVPPELARHPKYLILRELGRGDMGIVYQARHKELGRQIVIKVIERSLLDQPDALERFRREVRAAAQLSHPNIVIAYDAEQAGDLFLLVMEFVPGQSLAEVLEKKGPLPVASACHYMRQVALGLKHAHERGMVHRDIKPSNLILMPEPKGQVKILDFGLAKIISECSASKGLTESSADGGTPDYCAPEQAVNAAKADIRADLYSLGCTLYCLLAGHPPFQEDTVFKTYLAHREKKPRPLPELRKDVPVELWQVVKRLLAKNPAQRYQKPIEVFRALSVFAKPSAKPKAKGGSAPAPSVGSPVKGTKIKADTKQIKKVLQEVPGKTPPKKAPAKEEVSPFANLVNTLALPRKAERAREATKRALTMMRSRLWPVLAAAGVLLLVLVGLLASRVFNDSAPKPASPSTEEIKKPAPPSAERTPSKRKGDEAP